MLELEFTNSERWFHGSKGPPVHLTEAVAIGERARRRLARSYRFRLCGIFVCIVSAAVIITGLMPFKLWNLGDPDANGFAVYFSFFLLYIGWALIEGRKMAAIYLRRFGSTDANKVITDAFKARIGSAYRLVALDDLEIKPTQSSRLSVLLSVLVPLMLSVMLTGIATYIYELRLRQRYSFGDSLDQGLTPQLIVMCFGGCGILAAVHIWRVFRRSHLQVIDRRGVHKVAMRVLKLSSWLRGPRLMDSTVTVVRVADSEWQSMVTTLLKYTENVIIDVSIPTSNLLWELQRLSSVQFRNCVIIANRELFLGWPDTAHSSDETRDLYDQARALLVDREILLYGPSENHAQTLEWQDNLRRALDNVADFQRYTAERRRESFKPRMISMLKTVVFYWFVIFVWIYSLNWIDPLLKPIVDFAKSLARRQ